MIILSVIGAVKFIFPQLALTVWRISKNNDESSCTLSPCTAASNYKNIRRATDVCYKRPKTSDSKTLYSKSYLSAIRVHS